MQVSRRGATAALLGSVFAPALRAQADAAGSYPQALKPVVDKLNREMNCVLEMAHVRKIFARQGLVPDGGTPAQFHSFIESQKSLRKRVIQQNHITAA